MTVFKELYFHLYSNSKSSRAEKIFEDIAKILLIKIINDTKGQNIINKYLQSNISATVYFIPILVEEYPDYIVNHDSFSLDDRSIKSSFAILSQIYFPSFESNILSDAFESIIGSKLRGDKGQFFTPKAVIKAMVEIAKPENGQKIVDPAAGTGGFLIETYKYLKCKTKKVEATLVGIEKDSDLVRFSGPFAKSITESQVKMYADNSLAIKRQVILEQAMGADVVLTNPPFGSKIGITEQDILKKYNLGHDWSYSKFHNQWFIGNKTQRKQDPQTLFLEFCLSILKPCGLLGIVLPEGLFGNKKTGYIWDFVDQVGEIEAMIDCPRTTFQPYTDTKTNIIFIRKGVKSSTHNVKIAVARHCGHDKRGKELTTSNEPIKNDFDSISKSYDAQNNDWWKQCLMSDKYYIVPRFYHKKANEEVISYAKAFGGEVITIGELVKDKVIKIRKGHEVGSEAYGSGDIPFVRTSDISNWEISADPTNGVSELVYNKYKRSQSLKIDDVLLVVDGRYKIGKTAIIQNHNIISVIQSHIKIITTLNKTFLSGYELLYLLNLPCVLDELRNLVFIQSTLGSVGKRLEYLQLPIPQKTNEWHEKISMFKGILQKRAILLEEMQKIKTPEPQL